MMTEQEKAAMEESYGISTELLKKFLKIAKATMVVEQEEGE